MWMALALVLSVWAVVWRTEVLLRLFVPDLLAQRAQLIALSEQAVTAAPEREPLPPDLEAIADRETEPWAREQVRAAILDDYAERQDWDEVRAAYFGTDT
jgi:hypothetical protein